MKEASAVFLSLLMGFAITTNAHANPLLKVGTAESSTYEEAMGVDCPEPEIPSELKEDCLKTSCVARFEIKADGKSTVKIVTSSGSEQVDDVALQTLRRWRFKPATLDGKPIASSRRIRVEFEIE